MIALKVIHAFIMQVQTNQHQIFFVVSPSVFGYLIGSLSVCFLFLVLAANEFYAATARIIGQTEAETKQYTFSDPFTSKKKNN